LMKDSSSHQEKNDQVRVRSDTIDTDYVPVAQNVDDWDEVWNMITYRTGIIEPEIFFQRLENRATLEGQMAVLKKQSELRLEQLKNEITLVEQELEEVSYDASFTGTRGQDTGQKKKDIIGLQVQMKHNKERTESYEALRKDAIKGLLHISKILGMDNDQQDLDKININEKVREIEVIVDALLEENSRLEAAADKNMSQSQSVTDMKVTVKDKDDSVAIPHVLINAVKRVDDFVPRVPIRLPSKFMDEIVPSDKKQRIARYTDDDDTPSNLDRENVKAASMRIIRQEKIKEAKIAKEEADKLAAAMRD
jgi:hypothetical protein